MALQGSLGHLGLADLLQTGLAGQAAGLLSMRNGAGRAALYVGAEGLTLLEPDVLDAEDLIHAFVLRGVLSGEAVERERGEGRSGLPLIESLVASGELREAELTDVLAGWAEDTILDLLTWDEGEFRFVEGPLEQRRPGLVCRTTVDSGAVLLRAAQRLDERNEIASSLGYHAALVIGLPGITVGAQHMGDPGPRMQPLLDGERTIDEVALLLGIGGFAALKAAHALVLAGGARLPTAEELAMCVEKRLADHAYRSARGLVLQWIEMGGPTPRAYESLALIAQACGRTEEEIDALRMLAQLRTSSGSPGAALGTLRDALIRCPNHPLLLQTLRDSAEAAGDVASYVDSTLRMAENALQDAQGDRAVALLEPLVTAQPDALGVRTMHAKALERCGRIEELVAAAQDVTRRIGRRCRTREERDAARTFADMIDRSAPERPEISRRLRSALERSDSKPRRFALAGSLLAVLAVAGIVMWPPSADSLLERATVALDAGRRAEAQELLDELIERYPDSPEAESAFQLQARLTRPAQPQAPTVKLDRAQREHLEASAAAAQTALGDLPSAAARDTLESFAKELASEEASALRPTVLKELRRYLARAMHDLTREARGRAEILAKSSTVASSQAKDEGLLRRYLAEAAEAGDAEWTKGLQEAVPILGTYVEMEGTATLHQLHATLAQHATRLAGAGAGNQEGLDACHRAVLALEVDEAYRKAAQDGIRELTYGRLESAEELYSNLETLVEKASAERRFEPLFRDLERQRIPAWIDSKRQLITTIGQRVREGRAHEAAGRLAAASQAYAGLLRTFDTFKLERLAPLPLQVLSDPPGAIVEVNGKREGVTPLVIHYLWSTPVTVRVLANGYVPFEQVLDSAGEKPDWQVEARLAPQPVWAVRGERTIDCAPVEADGNVLTASRGGRLTMYDGKVGSIIWTRALDSLEGIRFRPAYVPGRLYVVLVDGTVHLIDPRDGAPGGRLTLDRPTGDPDVAGDVVAVPTRSGKLVLLRHGSVEREITLPAPPSTNVVAAHGAFWVGLGDGRIARVHVTTGRLTVERIGDSGTSVRALGGAVNGIAATTSMGDVAFVGSDGRRRWSVSGQGDLPGRPAVVGGYLGVVERKGRLLVFDVETGQLTGTTELSGSAPHGLLGVDDVFVTALEDGRIMAIEPEGPHVRVESGIGSTSPLPPARIGADHLVIALKNDEIGLVPVPRRPDSE
ncbi:MAG: PQQ-binding-like beta-propeller repeat protein [Planctomycetes bacterium]|nr:PQQ-binding-like beta-propeller repeat protein [Planctomycetota bacterium]MCB9825475.1 PQQ-binding-like beta-propeller repeat protein [Planctomycetota bacterium]MCB9829497.1 PQQ-binding-like beta-propeller repeat protein [Planctomycetota bacterium]MCB9900569.1 PQQ-binding-like beta-propeller repeat protein [Planctomycetota bacterium]